MRVREKAGKLSHHLEIKFKIISRDLEFLGLLRIIGATDCSGLVHVVLLPPVIGLFRYGEASEARNGSEKFLATSPFAMMQELTSTIVAGSATEHRQCH